MFILKDGTVVTGDGKTLLEKGSVLIRDGEILGVTEHVAPEIEQYAEEVIDCTGKCIMPGMINHHNHGVTFGPIFASGLTNYGKERIMELLDRNFLQGCTTVLNVDGFVTMDEVKETQKCHPMRIKTATTHGPLNLEACMACDGRGISEKHKIMSMERMMADGAVCIGEVGGGHTLGGGGQDYLYIPRAVKAAKGVDIDYLQARAMKLSVRGRYIEKSYYDRDTVAAALKENNLDSIMTPEECRDIVYATTYASVQVALSGYEEAARVAKALDVPLMCHNAPTSMKKVQEVAKMGLNHFIACHSNYLFTRDEAVVNTMELKQNYGVIIDAAVHDPWGAKRLVASPENLLEFYKLDLMDVVSTDFANGTFDSMLESVEHALEEGLTTLPRAIAYCTKNVADAIPLLAPNLGLLKEGYTADVLVTSYPHISQVERIYVNGKLVAKDGVRLVDHSVI